MLFDTLESRQMFSQTPVIDPAALGDFGATNAAEPAPVTVVVGLKHAVSDSIGAGDADDLHRISLDRNVTFKALLKAPKGAAELTLVNAQGASVGQGKLKSVKGNLEAGDYFLKVHSPQDASASYKLSFQAKAAKKPAASLLPGGTVVDQTKPPELPPASKMPLLPWGLGGDGAGSASLASDNLQIEGSQQFDTQGLYTASGLFVQGGHFRGVGSTRISVGTPAVRGASDTISWLPVVYRWDAATGTWSQPMWVTTANGSPDWVTGTVSGSANDPTWVAHSYMTAVPNNSPVAMTLPTSYTATFSVGQTGWYAAGNYVYSHRTGEYAFEWSQSGGSYYSYVS